MGEQYIYFAPNFYTSYDYGEFLRHDTAAACFADLDRNDIVGLSDLAILLGNYGGAGDKTYADGDLTGDGAVNLADLAALWGYYGRACS